MMILDFFQNQKDSGLVKIDPKSNANNADALILHNPPQSSCYAGFQFTKLSGKMSVWPPHSYRYNLRNDISLYTVCLTICNFQTIIIHYTAAILHPDGCVLVFTTIVFCYFCCVTTHIIHFIYLKGFLQCTKTGSMQRILKTESSCIKNKTPG